MTTRAASRRGEPGTRPPLRPVGRAPAESDYEPAVLVPKALIGATIRYLASRPFGEVHQLVPALMACRPPVAAEAEPDTSVAEAT